MFNLFQYNKNQQDNEELAQDMKNKEQQLRSLKQKNDKFAQNYKKKVQDFIREMKYNPIVFNETPKPHQFREVKPESFIKSPNFKINGFNSERDRVNHQIKINDIFNKESKPIMPIIRYRVKNLELNGNYIFKEKTQTQRIQNSLEKQTLNTFDYQTSSQNLIKNNKKSNKSNQDVIISNNKSDKLLPELHRKTHFQAVTSVNQNLPLFSYGQDSNENISFIQNNENKDKDESLTYGILESCNVKNKKHKNVKILKQGQGKFISNPEKSVQEIYQNLYKN